MVNDENESIHPNVLKQLNTRGFEIDYSSILNDWHKGRLVVEEESELRRWSLDLLHMQGSVVNEISGSVHVVGIHNPNSNISGQISVSKPNTMSIPKWVRPYLIAPHGRRFVSIDIHAAEPRSLAWVANDEVLEKVLAHDIYQYVAKSIYRMVGIQLSRAVVKKLMMGYFYGQTVFGVEKLLKESQIDVDANKIFEALQSTFPKTTKFLGEISLSNKAFLVGQFTNVDVSEKSGPQRKSFVASSIVAAIVKRWAANLLDMDMQIWLHEIPRDALWLTVPEDYDDQAVLSIGYQAIQNTLSELQFYNYPMSKQTLSLKTIGGKKHVKNRY